MTFRIVGRIAMPACAFLIGCDGIGICDIQGSGNVVQVSRSISAPFTAMAIRNGFAGRVTVDPNHTGPVDVVIRADDNVVRFIRSQVQSDRLDIEWEDDVNVCDTTELVANAIVGPIAGFSLSGGSDYDLVDIFGDRVTLGASGGSDLRASGRASTWDLQSSGGSDLELNLTEPSTRIELDSSGGGTTRIAGASQSTQAKVSGGGVLEGGQLTSGQVDVNASGGSTLTVCVEGSLQGTASGGSTVTFLCNPAGVAVETSGGSTVSEG